MNDCHALRLVTTPAVCHSDEALHHDLSTIGILFTGLSAELALEQDRNRPDASLEHSGLSRIHASNA